MVFDWCGQRARKWVLFSVSLALSCTTCTPSTLNLAHTRQNNNKKHTHTFQSFLFRAHCLVHFFSIRLCSLIRHSIEQHTCNTFIFNFHSVYFRYSSKLCCYLCFFPQHGRRIVGFFRCKPADLHRSSRWSVGFFLISSLAERGRVQNRTKRNTTKIKTNRKQ